jgi:hypothetical protein
MASVMQLAEMKTRMIKSNLFGRLLNCWNVDAPYHPLEVSSEQNIRVLQPGRQMYRE